MKNKIKLLTLIMCAMGIIVTSVCTVSMAANEKDLTNAQVTANNKIIDEIKNGDKTAIGKTLSVSHAKMLKKRTDLYCIQHIRPLEAAKFTVGRYITIGEKDANTATIYTSKTAKGETTSDKAYARLAYILAQNEGFTAGGDPTDITSNYYSAAQKILYMGTAKYAEVDLGIKTIMGAEKGEFYQIASEPIDWFGKKKYEKEWFDEWKRQLIEEGTDVNKLWKAANEYANSIGKTTDDEITDKTNKNNISVTAYTSNNEAYYRVGPFNLNFNGKIKELNVYNQSNAKISNVKYSVYNGNTEKSIGVSEITSGQNFYISIKMDTATTKISNIEIKTETTGVKYTAKLWYLKTASNQELLLADAKKVNVPNETTKKFEYNIPLTKNLTIVKVDSRNSNIKLEGVGFKIKNKETGKYVKKQQGKITYVDNKESATEFVTDSNGKIVINGLILGTYLAEETKNPNYGYKTIDGSIEIAASTTTKTIKNEQIYVKVSGYVWKDIQSSKKTIRNDLYKTDTTDYSDDQDTAFNGIIVRLKDKDGKTIKETTTGENGLYSEIEGGEYVFRDVLIDQLSNYYIEFEYDGLIYQSVAENLNKNAGSKASDKTDREKMDKNFAMVTPTGSQAVQVRDNAGNETYKVTYSETTDNASSIKDSSACKLTANTKDAGYSMKFSAGTTEIRYINLGLYEKAQADLSLTQDLETINVGVNGYWHIYKYATRSYDDSGYNANDSTTWNVGVKFKNSYTGTYRRALYQSDIDYEKPDDRNKELQVYLTYKIALTNESSYLTRVNSIVDYFDNRYTLTAAGTGLDAQNNITGNISYDNSRKYNDKYQTTTITVNTTVESGKTNYIYVQFKLDRSAVVEIMNNRETLSNIAEITSYTVYKDNGNTVAAIDRDSVPGNAIPEQTSTYEDDTDAAPAVQLEIADARKITGTVFVDNTTGELLTGQIRQGNGQLDNGESTVKGVKVTLHEINNAVADIVKTTDENGNYEITGYIPGQYVVTYTWGDKTYTVQNYKGTVYNSNRNQNDMYWYKSDVDTRYTDAIDNYQTRIAIDNEVTAITNNTVNSQIADAYNGGNNHPNITITTMDSTTPTMEFGVEYETAITDGTIDKVEFIVKNIDFGIVERARQQLDMIKRVSSFKITLANGQVLVDCTVDENGNLNGVHNYVTYMGPSINNGYSNNGFIKAEIDNELIEGSTLEVGYEIKFVNNSELDYMSENYYKYGKQEGHIITLTPSAVVDYLDKNLVYEQSKNSAWKQITAEELNTLNAVKVGDTAFLNSRTILYTENTAKPIKPTETTSVNLNVSKLLTTSGNLAFNNDAETVSISKNGGSEHKGSVIKYFPTDSAEEVEITPSTGENKNYVLPVAIGMIALVALGAGVFSIKKFVIDNK